MCVLRSFLSGTSTDILQGRRHVNPPKPVGYERGLQEDQRARQRIASKQDGQVKPETIITTPSPARSLPPILGVGAPALTRTTGTDSLLNKKPPVKPAVPLINPCNRFRDNNKGIVSDSLPLSNSSTQPEKKPVCWKGINSSISSSPGFHIWAEKLAMLTGETESRAESSQTPPMKQGERKRHTARAPSVAVPRFLESPQTRK